MDAGLFLRFVLTQSILVGWLTLAVERIYQASLYEGISWVTNPLIWLGCAWIAVLSIRELRNAQPMLGVLKGSLLLASPGVPIAAGAIWFACIPRIVEPVLAGSTAEGWAWLAGPLFWMLFVPPLLARFASAGQERGFWRGLAVILAIPGGIAVVTGLSWVASLVGSLMIGLFLIALLSEDADISQRETTWLQADLYETLGLHSQATPDHVEMAYRRLVMELHPDRNPDDPDSIERFKEVKEAYEILSDPERRAQYDRVIEAERVSSKGDRAARADESMSKKELYEIARRLDIGGRSNMNKAELIDAINLRG